MGTTTGMVADIVVEVSSAVDDMARAAEGQAAEAMDGARGWAGPFLPSAAVVVAEAARVVDEWRRTVAAAFEKARMGEALREASTVKASATEDTFII